jgi:thiamine biosynthesis lipoprotein
MLRIFIPAIFLILSLPGFKKTAISAFRISGYAQGTTYHITYYAADSSISQQSIDSIFSSIDSSLSLYQPYSLINQFNQSLKGVKTDRYLSDVVHKSIEIYKETNGISDITVQPLVEAWGFSARHVTEMPDSSRIQSLLLCVGSDKIQLKGDFLYKQKPCVRIDVNGIAQGYSVDVLAAYFKKRGVNNFLIEVGGELIVSGRKQPGNEVMRVGIESPGNENFGQEGFRQVINLTAGALTTSGNYRKFYENGSKKISHLIDPHTGFSFANELISVTVWAKDAITADGYDNALMGMGLKKAFDFLKRKNNLEAYFIYSAPGGSIKDTATTGFYALMRQ